MPLLDHFHPPISEEAPWDGVHGQWPAMLVIDLNQRLPKSYRAMPRVHLGASFEIDIATVEDLNTERGPNGLDVGGGTATMIWAAPTPTLTVEADLQDQDEYEVRVYDDRQRRLVAAIEIVSPANKDRPDHRSTFAAKCAALLQQGVSVSIVDLVTNRNGNLYLDTLHLLGEKDPAFLPDPPSLYASASRYRRDGETWKLESWAHPLRVGQPLPTLPLWLSAEFAVPLELEQTYKQTCQALRIP